ncbi:O-antigen ligase family protein [Patescibacteria group bacterium]|nr:O-antigen ligase family protein [Patescibacteria group bacterium]
MQKLLSSADRLFKYLIAAVLLAVPLYPKFPLLRIPGTYVSIRLEDFLIFVIAVYIAVRVLPRAIEFMKRDVERAMLIYLAVGLVSLVSAIAITHSVVFHIGILHWIRRIEYFVPFLAAGILFKKKDEELLSYFVKLLGIVVVITFIYGLGQRYFGWPIIITQNEEYAKGIALRWVPGSHINAGFAGHYDLASFLVMVLPIFVTLMALSRKKVTKFVLFLLLLAGLWLLSSAVSRISVVSYLIGVTLALLIVKKYKAIPVVLFISLFVFSLSGALIMRYSEIIDVTKVRLQKVEKMLFGYSSRFVYAADEPSLERRVNNNIPTPTPIAIVEDRSTSIRLNIEWPRAIRALSKNPLLGTGYSSITLATDNDYLRLLGETGILGFLAFALIFLRIGEVILKSLPFRFNGEYEKAFVAGFIGSLPGLFLNATFIDIFEASKFAILFWLLMGILVSLARLNKNEQ